MGSSRPKNRCALFGRLNLSVNLMISQLQQSLNRVEDLENAQIELAKSDKLTSIIKAK
jgi:hypothetical protein